MRLTFTFEVISFVYLFFQFHYSKHELRFQSGLRCKLFTLEFL